MSAIQCPVAVGELIDKITILEIKDERLKDAGKIANVRRELRLLRELRDRQLVNSPDLYALAADLKTTNAEIWELEDRVRECERRKDFGDVFVEIARAIYHKNDRRAELKRHMNVLAGSELIEEKSYEEY